MCFIWILIESHWDDYSALFFLDDWIRKWFLVGAYAKTNKKKNLIVFWFGEATFFIQVIMTTGFMMFAVAYDRNRQIKWHKIPSK